MGGEEDKRQELLVQYEALIHKTMKRLNISQTQMHYEDFTQELSLHMLELFETFDGKPLAVAADRYKFAAYAGQGLYWHGLNLLRKDKLDVWAVADEEQLDGLLETTERVSEDLHLTLHIEDFLNQAQSRLTGEDYHFLLQLAQSNGTITDLAAEWGVSRATVYERRKKIQKRLSDLKDCLKN